MTGRNARTCDEAQSALASARFCSHLILEDEISTMFYHVLSGIKHDWWNIE